MKNSPNFTDIIIIGAGLAGLTAAHALSKAGRSVTILEKSAQIGGRAASQQKGGFTLNLGPHAFYRAGEAFAYLTANQFALDGGLPRQTGSLALTADETHLLPASPASFLKTKLLTAREKLQVGRALTRLLKDDPEQFANVTIADYIADLVPAGRPRQLFHLLSNISTYANAPDLCSADVLILQYQRFSRKNVLYLDNGWQAVVNQFAARLQAAGVTIQTRQKVMSVQESDQAVAVTLTNGQIHQANAVIIAASPELVDQLLPSATVATGGLPIQVASFEVALQGEHDPTFYFAGGLHKPYYYSVHSAAAKLAPAGQTLIHLAKYLAPEGPDADAAEAEFEALLDRVLPGWRPLLVHKRFLPHIRAVNRLAPAASGGLQGRQPVRISGLRRTFLAGDWIGKNGWLVDASVASALQAARYVLTEIDEPIKVPAI